MNPKSKLETQMNNYTENIFPMSILQTDNFVNSSTNFSTNYNSLSNSMFLGTDKKNMTSSNPKFYVLNNYSIFLNNFPKVSNSLANLNTYKSNIPVNLGLLLHSQQITQKILNI